MYYEHNWTGLLAITIAGLIIGAVGLFAARREAAVKRREAESKERFRRGICIAIRKYPWLVRRLANEYEVSDSTVRRWAQGVAAPLPRLRWLIMNYVNNAILECGK